jgi:predicted dehydrogenase
MSVNDDQPPNPESEPESTEPQANRRGFLRNAAALGGLGFLGSCAATAKDRGFFGGRNETAAKRGKPFSVVGDEEALRIGVIGVGGMGTGHCHSIANLAKAGAENVLIVAVSDVAIPRMEDVAKVLKEKQGIEVAQYQDYREMLARDDIHGVLIATPEHWHADCAIDAIMSGKDVYVEKPMTYDLEAGIRLYETAMANEMIVQVGTQKVMMPKFGRAKELLAAGAIGKPVWSQTSYCRNSPDGEWNYYGIDDRIQPGSTLDWKRWCEPLGEREWDPLVYFRWRRYHEYSTGVIGDLLVHVMTPLAWAIDAGWPTRVNAIGGHYVDKEMDNFDQVNMTIKFEKDHTMVVAGSTANDTGLETLVRGNEGDMYLGGNNVVIRPQRAYVDDIEPSQEQFAGINDQDQLRLNWFSCMRTRKQNASTVEMGLKVMVMVDLAHRSMWDGKTYDFDPSTFTARPV